MNHVLLLGGGVMQIPAIMAGRKLGWKVTVVDGNPQCPGAEESDEFATIDLKDVEGLLEFARDKRAKEGLDAVFTAGTDFSASVAYLAEHLGLPGHSYQAALNATDKARMRSCFRAAGLNQPKSVTVSGNDGAVEVQDAAQAIGYPLVVKPVDNMGARGVRRLDAGDDLQEAVAQGLRYSRSNTVQLEQFIQGPEFSIDALVYDGRIHITGFADRHVFFPPYFVEMGHTIPTQLSLSDQSFVVEEFKQGVRALGLTHGAAKGDVFLSPNGPVVGEIAARLSGGYMSGWTYPYSTGVDLTGIAMKLAAGLVPSDEGIDVPASLVCAERAVMSIPGIVDRIVDETRSVPGVRSVFLRAEPGQAVAPPLNNVEKAANVIVVGANHQEAEARANEALSRIQVQLVPCQAVTDRYLMTDGWKGVYAMYGAKTQADQQRLQSTLSVSPRETPADDDNGRDITASEVAPLGIPLQNNRPGIHPDVALDRIANRRGIRFNATAANQEVSTLFWRAFLAGGEQGIDYLLDSMREDPACVQRLLALSSSS